MVEQNNNEVMIQLPWIVPQQPLVTTQISVDPKNPTIPLDIQHSTDTTAISSFALSVIIALILGCLATWLAYWYGRKSFQLTEMSFKTVVEEIKASQQSSLDLNAKLFEQQQLLQKFKLNFESKNEWVKEIRIIGAEFQIYATDLILKCEYFEQKLIFLDSVDRHEFYNKLSELNRNTILSLVKLDLCFEPNNKKLDKIIIYSDMFTVIAKELLDEYISKKDAKNLEKFLPNLVDDEYFTIDEKKELSGSYRIQVLSFLMRKINNNLKSLINEKAA